MKTNTVFIRFTLLICFFFSVSSFKFISAQSNMEDDESLHKIEVLADPTYLDYKIPENTTSNAISFELRGGAGGWAETSSNCKANGGEGATTKFTILLGQESNQIPRGSTIRFIVGEAGTPRSRGGTGLAAGGGGGGSGLLVQKDGEWVMLGVAGGGGGAFVSAFLGECIYIENGQGGRSGACGGNGRTSQDIKTRGEGRCGGTGGTYGGISGLFLSGGGGGYKTAGTGAGCDEGFAGGTTGGEGGAYCFCNLCDPTTGGWGFGGGGAGLQAGGGGGGYSGGGGGGPDGNGGGGGSFTSGKYAHSSEIIEGGSISEALHGFIEYQFKTVCTVAFTGTVQFQGFDFIEPVCSETGKGTIQMQYEQIGGNFCNLEWRIYPDNDYNNLGNGSWSNVGVGLHRVSVINTDLDAEVASAEIQVRPVNATPTAKCKDITVTLGGFETSIEPNAVNNGSTVSDIGCDESLSFELSTTDFTCYDVYEENIVTMTVTGNNSGQSATCEANVTVKPFFSGTASCRDDYVYDLAGRESATIGLDNINFNSIRSYCFQTLELNPLNDFEITPEDVGSIKTYDLTLTDIRGELAPFGQCSTRLTIIDSSLPTAECKEQITVQLDENSNASLTPEEVNLSTGIPSDWTYELSQANFDCNDIFDITQEAVEVTLRIINPIGGSIFCMTNVKVEDNIAPVVSCQEITVDLDENQTAGVITTDLINTINENCKIKSVFIESGKTSYNCDDVGQTFNVLIQTEDAYSNVGNCTAKVTIADANTYCNQAPVALCQDITVQADDNCEYTVDPVEFDAGSNDPEGDILEFFLDNELTYTVGEHDVNFLAFDGYSYSPCFATITVEDNIMPTAITKDITVYLNAAGQATITADDINNGSSDNCGTTNLSVDINSFSCADIGANTLTLTVNDGNGNNESETATVTVVDNVNPTASCQNITIQLDANGNASTTAAAINNGSTDACGISSVSLDETEFDCSNIGDKTVTLTVTDVNNNSSSCTAAVTVEDKVIPTANCQDVTIQLDANGNANTTAAAINNGSNDACGISSISLDETEFDCSNVGDNTVTLTVTDVNNNSSSCTAAVTVEDKVIPTANCQDVTLQLDANGNASTTANAINNGSTDNCGIASISLDKTEFDCSDLGNNIVTLTVTDVNNNSSTCTAGVTIEDEITPTAVCQDYTLQLNGKSNTVDPVSVDGGSYDNCGIANFILDRTSFSCDDIGTAHDVILTVEDQAGLISACRATITVEAGIALPDDFSTASIGSSFGDALHNACEEAFYLSSGQTSTYNYTEGWGEMTYVNLSGDFTFTAEVKSMSSNSVAGIMVRHGSSSGDMMGFVAKHGYTMTGGVTLNGNGKVVRTRSGRASRTIVFTVTRIGDRLTFKQGRTTLLVMDLDMGSNAMVGLFLSSSNDEEATATFHNVSYSSSTNSSFTQATNSEMFPYEGAGDGSSSTKESKASPISELESGVSNNKSTLSSLSRQGDEFKVYPNPTQGQITIDLQAIIGNSAVLNVYNMVGQQVYSENMGMVYDAQKQLDLSNLEKGTYLITIESAGQLLQQKIVLQK